MSCEDRYTIENGRCLNAWRDGEWEPGALERALIHFLRARIAEEAAR